MGCLVSLVRRVEIAQRDSLPTVLLGLLVAAGENIPKGRCSREYSMTCFVRCATPAAAAEGHAEREERNCRLTRATPSLKTRARNPHCPSCGCSVKANGQGLVEEGARQVHENHGRESEALSVFAAATKYLSAGAHISRQVAQGPSL